MLAGKDAGKDWKSFARFSWRRKKGDCGRSSVMLKKHIAETQRGIEKGGRSE